ncbi:MAG: DUF4914 family protein, partial [Bacteroidales bacterium]
MNDFLRTLEKKKISLPDDLFVLLQSCKSYTLYENTEDLAKAALGGNELSYEVEYDIPGKGKITEAIVHKVTNGTTVPV